MSTKEKRNETGEIPRLSIVMRPIGTLKFNPLNPRRHDQSQIRKLARSIRTFKCITPILINSSSQIVAGQGRVLAAQKLGLTDVPTVRLDHLSETQLRAFAIADNRLTEISTWDDKLLAEQLKELSQVDLEFSLEATGFDMGEIDFRIENMTAAQADDKADKEVLPVVGPTVTRPGDLWELGPHRVYCGSALESDSFAALMDGERAEAIFTDPPYNVRIDGHVSGLGAVRHREFVMACGEMDSDEYTQFLAKSFKLLARNSTDGSLHFIANDWRHISEVLAAGQDTYTELKNICVWSKNNAGMGSLYRSQHEFIFVFKAGQGPHRNNIQLGRHGRHRTNVWSYPGATTFSATSEEGTLSKLHPTVKPTRLIADAIMDCTSRGGLVLDSYLGSGTTVIAAERTGRRCYGLEIDPLYVDTIVRRWQTYTGETARHGKTKVPFDSSQEGTEHAH